MVQSTPGGQRTQKRPPSRRRRTLQRQHGTAQSRQDELRSGGRRGAPGARGRGTHRHRRHCRRPPLGGSQSHPPRGQIRRLRTGRSLLLPALAGIQPLSAVHLPPPPIPVPPTVQLLSRRGGLLSLHSEQGEHHQFACHDPTHPPLLFLQRTAPTGPIGLPIGPTRHHPPPRHLLPRRRLPWRNHRGVARTTVPRAGRTRRVPQPPRGAPGRCADDHGQSISRAAVHRVRSA
mmetsp:Transcript_10026/g.17575  ORF Transcript_10026/g.17575 Transcript_10026/m.17575 type:complete len:232 (+) Transcript_10026:189-884(+)